MSAYKMYIIVDCDMYKKCSPPSLVKSMSDKQGAHHFPNYLHYQIMCKQYSNICEIHFCSLL